ncbi:uncharacterized protein [Rutidosis leptorrhynchoides]|uniref:uncharacterized protein n=1 Tax=Rutidosis leptorrhynchoides TaxID=125765 RepID=UPI003A9956C4
MELMGFGVPWRNWMLSCLSSTSISILINGSPTKEFKLQKGLNHLTKLAVSNNRYSGIRIDRENIRLTHLQYADDTLFFGEWNRRNAQNLSKILKYFEMASGLRVNFHKSCVCGLGVSSEETIDLAAWLGCSAGTLPITYLVLPIGSSMKHSKAWGPVFEKLEKDLRTGRRERSHIVVDSH